MKMTLYWSWIGKKIWPSDIEHVILKSISIKPPSQGLENNIIRGLKDDA